MKNIQVSVVDLVTEKEIPDPVYYDGKWFRDPEALEDYIEMPEEEYEVRLIIGGVE